MQLTIQEVARPIRPGMAVPTHIAFEPGGHSVTFLDSAADDLTRDLWQLDLASGERSVILRAANLEDSQGEGDAAEEEALGRERERLVVKGITHYEWAETAPVLVVPMHGDLYVWRGDSTRRVARGTSAAHLSRDGSLVVYVRNGDLYCVAAEGGEERRLTSDAQPGVTNGLAEYVAQEEMGRRDGFWISPDGALVAFIQVDERHVPIFRIPHLTDSPQKTEDHRYPFTGADNVRLRLGLIATRPSGLPWPDLASGAVRWLDIGGAEYVVRVNWRNDAHLLVQLQSRDQKHLELRAFPMDSTRFRTLLVEESPTWVNLHDDLRVLDEGRFVWASERTHTKHLYLYDEERLVRPLTGGDLMVDRVVGVYDQTVIFLASGNDPLVRDVFRVSLLSGQPERLTSERGMHEAVVSSDGSSLVVTHHRRNKAPSVVLRHLKPGDSVPIAESAPYDYIPPELVTFSASDGMQLHAALYRPVTTPAPLVVSVYGGPHVQSVQESWALTVDLRAQFLASRGFAVLKVDNRGSARRGLAFESAIHRRMGTLEVSDQVDGVRYLANSGIVDPTRVGVCGWSYGGYLALMCLAKAPDVFRAGVAGAPITEWEGYDTHYSERYMSTPDSNPDGYRESSVLTHVANIRGALLLVHGMIDENVHFRHTARLIDALVKADKRHDLLLFPAERHLLRSERAREALEERLVAFFDTHLVQACANAPSIG